MTCVDMSKFNGNRRKRWSNQNVSRRGEELGRKKGGGGGGGEGKIKAGGPGRLEQESKEEKKTNWNQVSCRCAWATEFHTVFSFGLCNERETYT